MDKNKSQHYNFCYDAIPSMFHSQTKDFLKYLERDGIKFLQFWWDHVGQRLPFEKLIPFSNIAYEVLQVPPKTEVVFITLPPPQEDDEMYFLALVANPEKRFGWVRLPTTRILGLARRPTEKYPSGTELGDLTPRAIYVPLGEGPQPTLEAFKQTVLERIKRKEVSAR